MTDDARRFDGLYEAHQRLLYAYLLGQTGDREVASDLLQESFVRLWRNIVKVGPMPDADSRRWLLAIARNLVIDHFRKEGGRQGVEWAETAGGTAPDEAVIHRDEAARLDAAMARLDPDLRTPLVMSVVGEMKSAEIGAALGCPAGTVRYRIAEARRRLAKEVER